MRCGCHNWVSHDCRLAVCGVAQGERQVTVREQINIEWPAGAATGSQYVLPGKGNEGPFLK